MSSSLPMRLLLPLTPPPSSSDSLPLRSKNPNFNLKSSSSSVTISSCSSSQWQGRFRSYSPCIPMCTKDQDETDDDHIITCGLESDEDSGGGGGLRIPTQAQAIVEGTGSVAVSELRPSPDVDYIQELLAIQQQGPRTIGFFGTRNMGFMHQELIEILSYAMVITKNHIYTSGASGTNAAVIRGALRAERPELLTVILPQSLKKQPPESQELLSKVQNVVEKPHNDHLPLLEASRLCNMDIISQVQQVICFAFHDSGWENMWVEGRTLWDLGEATPIVVHLSETGSLPNGRALVPGCGTGYDVVVMANPDRHVIGLELSKTSVERSTKMFTSLPNSKHFSFLKEDFFTWEPTEKFDLIFDYNFFCAFEPKVRPLWAKRMQELLNPGGELITLMYPLSGGTPGPPPYQVSVSAYEELLIPLGFEVISIVDNELAPDTRKGMEKVGRWKKKKSV